MSPPSEVEKYIGTDLISSRSRRNNGRGKKPDPSSGIDSDSKFRRRNPGDCSDVVPSPRGKTGVPILVRFDDGKKKPEFEHPRMPLSRLAVHARGAPLMIAGRGEDRRRNRNRGNGSEFVGKRPEKFKKEDARGRAGTSDRLSVASDESSGSGHSENCLPRIIKPRKRRKKDRKPAVNADEPPSETIPGNDVVSADLPSEKKDLEEEEFHGPRLDHSFEDVTETDPVSYACSPSSCGCRYCDPSGIWDAPSSVPRKSWIEPVRPFPLWKRREVAFPPLFSLSFGETGSWTTRPSDENPWESLKGCEIDAEKEPSQGLQVSTEIVTSPNGHRDIEIRFYSASPPA